MGDSPAGGEEIHLDKLAPLMRGSLVEDEPKLRHKPGRNAMARSISEAIETQKQINREIKPQKIIASQAGVLSRASFWWMGSIMVSLYRDGLRCLFYLSWNKEDEADTNVSRLEKSWDNELKSRGPSNASLSRAMRSAYKSSLLRAVLVICVTLSFSFIGSACVLRLLLDHISDDHADSEKGIILVVALIVCELLRSFTFSLAWSHNYINGMRGRAAAMGLLYKKILRLRSLKDKKIGELVNMFSHDGQRVFEAMANGPFTVGGPFIFLAGAVYLCVLMGAWGLVALMTEVLTCMKLIKMNGWEPSFIRRITEKRTEEKQALERGSFFKSVVTSLVPMIPVIASVVMFLGYILSGNELTAARAFTVISCFYAMSFSLASALYGVQTLVDASVAMTRYKEVLLMPEQTNYQIPQDPDVAVQLNMATLTWESEEEADNEILLDEEGVIAGLHPEDVKALPIAAMSLGKRQSSTQYAEASPSNHPDVVESSTRLLPKGNVRAPRQSAGSIGGRGDSDPNLLTRLHDITLTVKKGELIGICGMKGSGKSSLLAAILGRMQLLEGEVFVSGSVAFSSQDPWIVNGTARDNILFGLPMDQERYDKIIKATRLDKDFETFGAGDEVEIGDRGLTMSGGQKQRICLARAIYSNSDILLLDDPLSSVDVNMGRHIFAQCLKTILHDKTVFMVTHHLEYLPKCDKVLYMHEGSVLAFGSHQDLMTPSEEEEEEEDGGKEEDTEKENINMKEEGSKGDNQASPYAELFHLYNNKYDRILKERMMNKERKTEAHIPQRGFSKMSRKMMDRQLSRMSVTAKGVQHQYSIISSTSMCVDDDVDLEEIVATREMPDCHVKLSTFRTYMQALGGPCVCIFLLVSFAVSIAIQSVTTGYLAYWLNEEEDAAMKSRNLSKAYAPNTPSSLYVDQYNDSKTLVITDFDSLGVTPSGPVEKSEPIDGSTRSHALVYGMLLLAMLVILVGRSYVFVKILLRASTFLHKRLLKKTLKSPMKFFDMTPIGIVLNRFSADLDEIDVRLPYNCEMFLQNIFLVLSALALISVVFPWDLLAIAPLVAVFLVLAFMFAPVLQRLKFMDNITRSPYLSHLAASVEGIATVSSFRQGQRFYLRFCEMLDCNGVPFFLFYAANRWLAVFLDSMTIIITGATGFLIVFTLNPHNSSQAGLALSFAIQITSLVQYTLRLSMETISRFTSIQRIQEYVEVLTEEGDVINNPVLPPPSWPSEGRITLDKYKMRYSETQQFVLKGISLSIQGQEKVGVVGNSGSGKSSLGVGLFRLSEAASGTITIDNVNIRDVPLGTLRSRLSILVQDPVLFTGTIRYNLDPSQTITSDSIFWQALEKCHMKSKIQSLEGGLDTVVEESGRNFSMGERQLMCLARTLLRNSKILVLDEATASVDTRTEALVQQTIRDCFQHCTVLMIAHRINTVWDCDKVLVLEGGKAVEFAHPTTLLQKSCSRFKFMFEVMKSTPRGASINEDPAHNSTSSYHSTVNDRPTSLVSGRPSGSPRLTSPLLQSPTGPFRPALSHSPVTDLSPLADTAIYDDDAMM
ncbi:tyrosine-protein kinase ryk [Plakobranchus ocellatus]|uniref:Tyrosine-protein kinase ryk n=2 Tax=Plakobranchus ocellatus TaxID=259542 RepID=A0AAV3Z446_9GAST|nr:tyrosine-protein kinase ryk [Plakobranchus ocellatus]